MSTLAAQALQEAMIAAARDVSERARAVGALRGAEVYASTWPVDPSALRTLQNSAGVRALALFTDERQLEEAALRFGWLGVDGHVPTRRMHISEAIRFARLQRVALVIVDITSDHALELDEGEMELVAAPPSTRPPSYAGISPVVSSARRADSSGEIKRVSTRPPPPTTAGYHVASALQPTAVNVDVEHHAVSATFAPATTTTMAACETPPPDEVVDALTEVLRSYCEVQWACFVGEVDRQGDQPIGIALRIDPMFRKHLPEISMALRRAADAQGAHCDVLVLETVEQMKRARVIGLPFYPWRKR